MTMPSCREDMRRAMYTFLGTGTCKGCGAAIEWWETYRKKKIPFNPISSDIAETVTHWSTCHAAKDSKGKGNPPAPATPAAPTEAAQKQREQQVRTLRNTNGARVVVAIFEDGAVWSWRHGIPAEDLRHDLITAANHVRNAVEQDGRSR